MPVAEDFPYRRIVDDLRAEILLGSRAAGERLPSENELAELYHTSRPTVRRAIAVLKGEGLVDTEQGRGAFVRPKPHMRLLLSGANYRRHRAIGLPGFNAQALEQGQKPGQVIREVTRVAAPADIALRLDVDTGEPVILRRRLFLLDDQPAALCDSYYSAAMAAGTLIEQPARIRGGVHALIEDPEGPIRRHVARSVDDILSRMPTPAEATELRLPPGVPVIRILRTVYDSEGRPIEIQDSVAAADRHQFRYEVEMR
jgi:GntR family transcriptional regulator